jgi:hypothetical protein
MGMEDGVGGENFTPGWSFFSHEAGMHIYTAWRIRSYDSPDYPLVFFSGALRSGSVVVWILDSC